MEIIEMVINENNDYERFAMSVVDKPAMEEDFICLSAVENIELAGENTELKILLGVAMIPEKRILRRREDGSEYQIFFSKETVREASQIFLKDGNQNDATIQHKLNIDGMSVVESWIVEDSKKDKSNVYGKEYPVGTWLIAMKADNEGIYQRAKRGEINGFSIEALRVFRPKESPIEMSAIDSEEKQAQEVIDLLIQKLDEL